MSVENLEIVKVEERFQKGKEEEGHELKEEESGGGRKGKEE